MLYLTESSQRIIRKTTTYYLPDIRLYIIERLYININALLAVIYINSIKFIMVKEIYLKFKLQLFFFWI